MNVHDIVRAYLGGESAASLATRTGRKAASIIRVLRARGVHIRNQSEASRMALRKVHKDDTGVRFMPTPEEIEARKAEIRASWSEEERAKRGREGSSRRFLVRQYMHNGVSRCHYAEV